MKRKSGRKIIDRTVASVLGGQAAKTTTKSGDKPRPAIVALQQWAAETTDDSDIASTAALLTDTAAGYYMARALEVLESPEDFGGKDLGKLLSQIYSSAAEELESGGTEEAVGILKAHFRRRRAKRGK